MSWDRFPSTSRIEMPQAATEATRLAHCDRVIRRRGAELIFINIEHLYLTVIVANHAERLYYLVRFLISVVSGWLYRLPSWSDASGALIQRWAIIALACPIRSPDLPKRHDVGASSNST
jgi:hypothetical protein